MRSLLLFILAWSGLSFADVVHQNGRYKGNVLIDGTLGVGSTLTLSGGPLSITDTTGANPTLLVKNNAAGGGSIARINIQSTGTAAAAVIRFVPTGTGRGRFQNALTTGYAFENSASTSDLLTLDDDGTFTLTSNANQSIKLNGTSAASLTGPIYAHYGSTTAIDGGFLQIFRRSRNATIGSHTILGNADLISKTIYQGSDGAAFKDAASIEAWTDGTVGLNAMPGRLSFNTTPGASSTLLERVRIDSSGSTSFLANGAASPLATTTKAGTKPVINTTTSGNSLWFGHSNPEYNGILGADSGGGTPWIGAFFYHSPNSNELRRSSPTNVPVSIRFGPSGTIDFTRNASAALDSTFSPTTVGTFNSSGNLEASIRNDGSCGVGNICTGTYSVTFNNNTNLTSISAAAPFNFSRVGQMITVGGQITVQATTANLDTSTSMTLPFPSDFSSSADANGTITCFTANNGVHPAGEVIGANNGNSTVDRATANWTHTTTGAGIRCVLMFIYRLQ